MTITINWHTFLGRTSIQAVSPKGKSLSITTDIFYRLDTLYTAKLNTAEALNLEISKSNISI